MGAVTVAGRSSRGEGGGIQNSAMTHEQPSSAQHIHPTSHQSTCPLQAPRWNETFVFADSEAADEAFPHRQRISITVKDSNKHLPDDYLGKVPRRID